MGDHTGGPMQRLTGPGKQTDSRKYLGHIVTAIISIVLSLGGASYFSVGKTGAAGPAGKTVIASQAVADQPLGVCAYFGPDAADSGHTRFQLFTPTLTTHGAVCKQGTLVSSVPSR